MAGKKLFGIIYMSTTRLELMIVNLKTHELIERVTSANFVQTADKSEIYQNEITKIVFSLTGFLQLMADYGVKSYKFWASQQLIDDVSARYLSEQILLRSGVKVNWLNTSQINYFRALSLMGHTKAFHSFAGRTVYLLYMGSAAVTLFKFSQEEFVQAWNIGLGYLELDQLSQALRNSANDPNEVLDDYISSKLDYLKSELAGGEPDTCLILQDFAALNNIYLPLNKRLTELPYAAFSQELKQAGEASSQYICDHFHVEDSLSGRILPGFLIARRLLSYTQAQQLYLTRLNIMDGLAIQTGADFGFTHKDYGIITQTSAENIAQLYIKEEAHRSLVRKLALHIFDQLKKLHRLGSRERLLLSIAATISDIGNAISQHNHYHHSAYIMEANPLIGLSDQENTIVSEIARYHSTESPGADQLHFHSLPPELQMTIAKLVAILRLADALDDSHQQKISKLTVSLKNEQLILTAFSPQDLSLEKWAFNRKAQLFNEIYGIKPSLKQRRTNA
ncbi:MAG: hypothetical protein IJU00_03970 [Selenomonas sp.]|nr:hypothetical protein [Selenomonas sp.]